MSESLHGSFEKEMENTRNKRPEGDLQKDIDLVEKMTHQSNDSILQNSLKV